MAFYVHDTDKARRHRRQPGLRKVFFPDLTNECSRLEHKKQHEYNNDIFLDTIAIEKEKNEMIL